MNDIDNTHKEFHVRKLTSPQQISERYKFIILKDIQSSYFRVLFGYDAHKFNSLEEMRDTLLKKISYYREKKDYNSDRFEISLISAFSQYQMAIKGFMSEDIEIYSEKLSIPEE